VSCVERHAVGLGYRWVEGGLHVVDGLRDEVEPELGVRVEIVEETCGVVNRIGVKGRGGWLPWVSSAP